MSSFFRNVDRVTGQALSLEAGTRPIEQLKARSLLVDMEDGPLNETLRSDIGGLFDASMFVSDRYGAGNNWASGYYDYGNQHKDQIEEQLRVLMEECDSLLGFNILHSLGGGTGSGLGSFITQFIHEEVCQKSVGGSSSSSQPSSGYLISNICVMPTKEQDDVIISPYNAVLGFVNDCSFCVCLLVCSWFVLKP